MKNIFILSILIFATACTQAHSKAKHRFSAPEAKQHKHAAKTRGFLSINLIEVKRDHQNIYLQATVTPHRDMTGGQTEWQLPNGVRISEGSVNQNIDFQFNKEVTLPLTVEIDSLSKGDKIFFFAYQMNKGERLGTSASFVFNNKLDIKASSLRKSSPEKKKKLIQ